MLPAQAVGDSNVSTDPACPSFFPMFKFIPPVTRTLILVNVAMFAGEMVFGDALTVNLALWPLGAASVIGDYARFAPWQLVTYGFLHANVWHIFVNMFALYMFGSDLERLFRPRRFLALYFAGVISAAVAQLVFSSVADVEPYPTIGASGAVFGLLLAYAMYFPRRIIMLLIPPIPMPAWLFVTLYGALELFLGVTGTQEGVAHFAHLGGMVGAWLLIQYWRGRLPFTLR
ncbi:MAG TPA: rhomboid family intramembrane serine protease [Bryobacteraceae bacterium]|nr:rhomboid family intramembrane serine protease [Bryobacteraceae bacterium]